MRSRGLTLATAALLAGAALSAPASAAAPADPGRSASGLSDTATFNTPPGNEILTHLLDLIQNADPGSTIMFTAFRFEEPVIAQALLLASKARGVKVQLLVDGGAPEAEHEVFTQLKTALDEDGNDETWARYCRQVLGAPPYPSCQGTNAMHNKFVLFSGTKGASNVVSTGSANMRRSSGSDAWNSWYTHVGDANLYNRYAGYFEDLQRMEGRPDYYDDNPPMITGNIKSYFYPRAVVDGDPAANDTTVHTLQATSCPGKIRIANWSVTRSAIAKELVKRAREGCSVDVVARKIHKSVCEPLAKAMNEGAPVRMWAYKQNEDDAPNYVHTKDMMIEAGYPNTTKPATVVFTGSANLNHDSLENNDENSIRIMNDKTVYTQFVRNFDQITSHAETSGQGFQIQSADDCGRAYPQG
ncbi:phosphatidylserine/phosphatidylglycerophosphate/cardiolipin synthase-like enzyme [Actinomadura luteofluorescens]|uniref:phospholipase D n=1 Tax=Actinomadura luteofluorescens TaxID=46163 RepID=A0A7Y9EG00_9ACTN|nr:phospholipase D-like domain-containing protein [Actinomadura luteofluorescens]NYD47009.1 phosphatidylserine/phosphatidylglycerophosphate/cardiolipin synthase-like enzyme [Actinomadura luteofluorescens]